MTTSIPTPPPQLLHRAFAFIALAFFAISLPAATFTVSSTAPAVDSRTIDEKAPLVITFGKDLADNWADSIAVYRNGMPGLYDGVQPLPVPGAWSLTNPTTVTFTPSAPYPQGSLLMVKIADSLTAKDGSTFEAKRGSWSFMVTPGPTTYKATETKIVIQKVMQNGIEHEIPITVFNPATPGPHPVMLWVHGGSWMGGTPAASGANNAVYSAYLTEKLGIACVAVGYRCLGSKGTFAQGIADVNFAINYVREHAAEFNIDPKRMGLYGGSAGTPLAGLAAQQQPGIVCYVGFNGVYDFTNNPGSNFPRDNRYEWQSPTPQANSACFNLAKNPPKTILMHGSKDTTINPDQSVRFGQQIAKAGGQVRVLIFNGEKHGFFNEDREMGLPALYEMTRHIKTAFGL